MEQKNIFEKLNQWLKASIMVKLLSVGFLTLVLIIPAAMIQELIREREMTREEAALEVRQKWGGPQTIVGPLMVVPAVEVVEKNDKTELKERKFYFTPENLKVESEIISQERSRGIHPVIVYGSETHLKGNFNWSDFKVADNIELNWDQAVLLFGVSDLKGIDDQIELMVNNDQLPVKPSGNTIAGAGIQSKITNVELEEKNQFGFVINLKLNGSGNYSIVPVAARTEAAITSNWSHPSFKGNFLPDFWEPGEEGFLARWKVLELNRSLPSTWLDHEINHSELQEIAFGTDFIIPVNEYQKNMRSAKYAILIIGLSFLIYFFIEVLAKTRIHPIQYGLIGLVLVTFYTLLLSLTEQIGFDAAYLIAAVAVVTLISFYSASIFKNQARTLFLAVSLSFLYGFLYLIIQMSEIALLAGSIGLFAILSVIMILTRRLDWYRMSLSDPAA